MIPCKRFGLCSFLLTFVAALAAACCGGTNNTATTDDMKGTITVAYSTTYVFDADDLSVTWWDKVKKEFEQQYPNAKLNLQGFNGTDVDLVNKVALEYKNPSTTPDVFMLPSGYVGQWVASDYLLPLDSFVNDSSKAPFWSSFPKVIQDESKICGKVYAVNVGENNSALYYNNAMLQKAGIQVPWQPKTWDDLLTAARAVKASGQKVVAFWAPAGTSAGAGGVLQGSANPIPTSKGQAPGSASTLGGWAVATSKVTKHPQLSWGLIKIMEATDNQVYMGNHAGFVPPSQDVAKSPDFLNYAPPFNKAFGDALPNSRLVPSEQEGYPAWVQGIGQATGQIATDPNTTIDQAIKILHDAVANQVGADKVETLT